MAGREPPPHWSGDTLGHAHGHEGVACGPVDRWDGDHCWSNSPGWARSCVLQVLLLQHWRVCGSLLGACVDLCAWRVILTRMCRGRCLGVQGLLNAEPGSHPGDSISSGNSYQFALTPVTQAAEDDGDTKADGDDGRDQHDISGGRPWGGHAQVRPAAHTTPLYPRDTPLSSWAPPLVFSVPSSIPSTSLGGCL